MTTTPEDELSKTVSFTNRVASNARSLDRSPVIVAAVNTEFEGKTCTFEEMITARKRLAGIVRDMAKQAFGDNAWANVSPQSKRSIIERILNNPDEMKKALEQFRELPGANRQSAVRQC